MKINFAHTCISLLSLKMLMVVHVISLSQKWKFDNFSCLIKCQNIFCMLFDHIENMKYFCQLSDRLSWFFFYLKFKKEKHSIGFFYHMRSLSWIQIWLYAFYLYHKWQVSIVSTCIVYTDVLSPQMYFNFWQYLSKWYYLFTILLKLSN